MRLASLKEGRDGRLIVVSSDMSRYADAGTVARTLQEMMDDWAGREPRLREIAERLERPDAGLPLDTAQLAAPLPRAFQWVDGSAYVNHVDLVRRARGAVLPESFWSDPLMYQGASDRFLASQEPIGLVDPAWGYDIEAEVCVVVDDVPQGVSREEALGHVRLVGLVNDVSLRGLIPGELAKGFGFLQSKPHTALSPVLATPDELGRHWRDGKLHLPLVVDLNGQPFGRAEAGEDMTFDFGTLIAHAAKARSLAAGSVVGSGTVSNRDADGGPGRPVAQGGRGYSCLAEVRMVETIRRGAPETPWLAIGDRIRIEMRDGDRSLFGAIEQGVAAA